jgi:hypothetical protein
VVPVPDPLLLRKSIGTSLVKTHVFRKRVRKVYQSGEVKVGYMVGIAEPV